MIPGEVTEGADPDFSIIIVNWNTRDLLRACLSSIFSQPDVTIVDPDGTLSDSRPCSGGQPHGSSARLSVEVIVVDNASSDGSIAMLEDEFPQVRLLANQRNLGFAAANNQAITRSNGHNLFLLNPDAYLLPGALNGLATFLRNKPQAAAVGPNVLNPDGSWQAASFRFPTLWDLFCEAAFLSVIWPRSPLFARRELGGFNRDTELEVDWVQGCALAIRREVWNEVGSFDEAYWMYVEELDWCRRARERGYRIFFTPDAQVVHHGKQAVAQARGDLLPLGFRSHFRYFGKFEGRTTELAVRAITIVGMGFRASVSAGMIVLTSGAQRNRWKENWRAYTGVIRQALKPRSEPTPPVNPVSLL
ncbi:MAG: glycosyltransferase family 2 protein [Chloroflexota bacterium]|nr:glycosyltransferase family 2 protein [Chloroflexota bacterium]